MAILLMHEMDVPATPRDRVFAASRVHAVLFVLISAGACVTMIRLRWPSPHLSYYISAIILLFLLSGHHFISNRFHPSNWLVRMGDEGMFIHFRSYLNEHLSAEDPTVAFVGYGDIRTARLVHERVKTRDLNNAPETQSHRYVELELAVDPAPLAAALAKECARPAAWAKRWYGKSATLYRDYPVLMQSPSFLRIEWKVVPKASAFLDGLGDRAVIAPSVSVSEDFTDLQALPREQQEKRLRELDQRGQTIAAVYMARRLYALDPPGQQTLWQACAEDRNHDRDCSSLHRRSSPPDARPQTHGRKRHGAIKR